MQQIQANGWVIQAGESPGTMKNPGLHRFFGRCYGGFAPPTGGCRCARVPEPGGEPWRTGVESRGDRGVLGWGLYLDSFKECFLG